jgi:uncharacterized protein (DUF1786 family)
MKSSDIVKTDRNSSPEKSSVLAMMWSDRIIVVFVVSDDEEGVSVALVGVVMGNGMTTEPVKDVIRK